MFNVSLSGQMFDSLSVWEHLASAVDFGYKAIELRSTHVSPNTPVEVRNDIRAYLNKHNMPVSCISCFTGNYGLLTDEECEAAFETFKGYLALADEFDAPMVRVWPGWVESAAATEQNYAQAAKWMRLSAEEAAKSGRKLVMEMHHGTLCDTPESTEKLLKAIDCENVGVILDPVNLYQVPVADVPAAIRRLQKWIFNVHIKDIIKLASPAHKGCFRYDFFAGHIGRFTRVVPPMVDRDDYYAHRRIGMGGVDWPAILEALEEVGYQGYLGVESVCENDAYMPSGRALAQACMRDAKSLMKQRDSFLNWHLVSPDAPGMHKVVAPGLTKNKSAYIFRLNLRAEESYTLESGELEMNALLISGDAKLNGCGMDEAMTKLDSFYIPGGCTVQLKAGATGAVFYIGAGKHEGIGEVLFRRFDPTLPIGDIHQIHGTGSGQREVFFTLNEQNPASRLICGITWGDDGMWTSYPPHQHEVELEEVYCYFDMAGRGMQLSYGTDGSFDDPLVHVVRSGHMVMAPDGYHPTVALPGTRNTYFWVLVANQPETRGYNYAKLDPMLA